MANNDYGQEVDQVLYITRSAEALGMHLDILYQSVSFLDKENILNNLATFKKQ